MTSRITHQSQNTLSWICLGLSPLNTKGHKVNRHVPSDSKPTSFCFYIFNAACLVSGEDVH